MVSSSRGQSFTVDQDSVLFFNVKIGFSRDARVIITNTSADTLRIQCDIVPQVSLPNEFQIITPQPPVLNLLPGEFRSILLRFKPQASGVRTSLLSLAANGRFSNVLLKGIVTNIQPDILSIPDTIDFGSISLGERKDTTYLLIGAGIDSIDIIDLSVANDNGAICFEAYPLLPQDAFPKKIGEKDTILMYAAFYGLDPIGHKTGRATAFGTVSGSPTCEFHGIVAMPDMEFSVDTLDLGVLKPGEVADSVLYLKSTGLADLLIEDILQPRYYIITNPYNFPRTLKSDDSLRIDIQFSQVASGHYYDYLHSIAKATVTGSRVRSVILHAFVLPNVLSSGNDLTIFKKCTERSTDEYTISLHDTGGYEVRIDSITTSNDRFQLKDIPSSSYILPPGNSLFFKVLHQPPSTYIPIDSTIISYYFGKNIIYSDTVRVIYSQVNGDVSITIDSSQRLKYTDSLRIELSPELKGYDDVKLRLMLTLAPPDIATLDSTDIFNGLFDRYGILSEIRYSENKDTMFIELPTEILNSNSSVSIPIQYNVADTTEGILNAEISYPGFDGCITASSSEYALAVPQLCGDEYIRSYLRSMRTASLIGSQILDKDQPMIHLRSYQQAQIKIEVRSIIGGLLQTYSQAFGTGIFSVQVPAVYPIVCVSVIDLLNNNRMIDSRIYLIK
jgi:hypothetical protein